MVDGGREYDEVFDDFEDDFEDEDDPVDDLLPPVASRVETDTKKASPVESVVEEKLNLPSVAPTTEATSSDIPAGPVPPIVMEEKSE